MKLYLFIYLLATIPIAGIQQSKRSNEVELVRRYNLSGVQISQNATKSTQIVAWFVVRRRLPCPGCSGC